MTVLIILVAPVAGKYSDRVGSRWLMGGGMILLAISLLIFSRLDETSNFWDVLPGLLVGGFGMAIVMTPTTAAAMGSVPVDKAGVGSAVLNSMRQVGGALGIAVMGAIIAASATGVPGTSEADRRLRHGVPARAPGGRGHRARRCDRLRRDRAEVPARRGAELLEGA